MRRLIDTILLLSLAALLSGVLWQQHRDTKRLDNIEVVQRALRDIKTQAVYRPAIKDAKSTNDGFALKIEPAWFDPRPENALLEPDKDRPWLEHVSRSERERLNPPHIAAGGGKAAFWYNPFRGLVRARVPRQLSHQATVELYNLVNGTSLHPRDVKWADSRPQGDDTDNSAEATDRSGNDRPESNPPEPLSTTPGRSRQKASDSDSALLRDFGKAR